jgi:anti-sigma B factor antagonist
MKISVRERGGVTILDVQGKIALGAGDGALHNAVLDSMNRGARNILMNLKDVSFIDSSGLGELVSSYQSVVNRGGLLKLLSVPPKVLDLMRISGLDAVFELFVDEGRAIASFSIV